MKERFVGSLIGQCLGDALGFVVEGYPAAECRDYVEDYLRAGRAGALGRAPFAFGQYTDDSQLARELLQSFVARGRFEPADYARRLAAIFAEGRIVGRGRTTEAAALRLAAGVAWQEAGTPAPNAGNGSAMRAGPVGLMFHDDEAALARAAHDQGRMTHADPRCSAGAVAIAGAVARALRGEVPTPAELADLAGRYDASVAAEIGRLDEWLGLAPAQAAPGIARAGLQPGFSDLWDGISPFVTSSVVWSLYAFLRSPADYWETVCTAIEVGGDVDTTAAMAGAIGGAYNGLAAVPEEPARRLTDRGSWGYEELSDLARKAWALKADASASRN
ncbi:MAG: ADP-ribosylglycohydrolase family protein [Rhodospirillales bacterium]|nr:ADP-ribosylglycohydrolase family protein [Rhodospirillales bacterium]